MKAECKIRKPKWVKIASHVPPQVLATVGDLPQAKSKDKVFKKVAEYIAWEITVLMSGRMPERGFANEEFDPKSSRHKLKGQRIFEDPDEEYCAAFVGVKGDRKSRTENHKFARSFNCTFICEECLACYRYSKGPIEFCFGDCTAHAGWRPTAISHELYMAIERWAHRPGERALGDLKPFRSTPGAKYGVRRGWAHSSVPPSGASRPRFLRARADQQTNKTRPAPTSQRIAPQVLARRLQRAAREQFKQSG